MPGLPGLDAFIGTWTLEREILHGNGESAAFQGVADWRAEGDGAIYEERGTLVLPGQGRFAAERRYRWARDLSIHFEDGRFFHRVPEAGSARHLCGDDLYEVRYDFAHWPDWQAEWRVRGPRKDYLMTSRYGPVGDAAARRK